MMSTWLCWLLIALISTHAWRVKSTIRHYNISEKDWNNQFRKGKWKYLNDVGLERARNAIISGVFIQKLSSSDSYILDVGCGEGTLSDFLHPNQRSLYQGIDLSSEAIHIANQKRPGLSFTVASVEEFKPTQGKLYSVIVFNEMLYYVDHLSILTKFANFLAPGGIIVISIWHTPKVDFLKKSIFSDANKVLNSIESMDLSGSTGPGKKKAAISFHIEGFNKKSN